MQRAVQGGAAVPSYYKSGMAKLAVDAAERPKFDPAFEEVTEVKRATRGCLIYS